MLTTRQWIAIAINIVLGNAVLLYLGFGKADPRGDLMFALELSAVAVALLFASFKLLPWGASWLTIVPAALIISFGVPTLVFAFPYISQPLAAMLTGFWTSVAGAMFVLPMFVLNCVLLRWGTRERRTNR
jgi:hypothetical protein